MTANIKRILSRVMGIPSVKNISAFRAFRTELRNAFVNFQNPSLIIDVLLSWGTSRFTSVPVDIEKPEARSNYRFSARVKAAVWILTGYSTTPLRLAGWIGFLMTIFGLGVFRRPLPGVDAGPQDFFLRFSETGRLRGHGHLVG